MTHSVACGLLCMPWKTIEVGRHGHPESSTKSREKELPVWCCAQVSPHFSETTRALDWNYVIHKMMLSFWSGNSHVSNPAKPCGDRECSAACVRCNQRARNKVAESRGKSRQVTSSEANFPLNGARGVRVFCRICHSHAMSSYCQKTLRRQGHSQQQRLLVLRSAAISFHPVLKNMSYQIHSGTCLKGHTLRKEDVEVITYWHIAHDTTTYHAVGNYRIHEIHLEGPEYPEYAAHIFYLKYSGIPKYGNPGIVSNPLPVNISTLAILIRQRKSPQNADLGSPE